MQQLILNLGEINKQRVSNKSLAHGADAKYFPLNRGRVRSMKFTIWGKKCLASAHVETF